MGTAPTERGPVARGTLVGGRYRLDAPLATGGMARVWTARDEVLDRPVAVKILLDHFGTDASFVTRFRAEALAAARLAHPSVVSVYDTCSDGGVEAIVMELVDGVTLRRRLDDAGPLDPAEATRIAARVADALSVAHRAGIVHRDIKPANVLLAPSGRVVVTDFGIAKASDSGDLTRDQMLGTAKYLSPEQVESRPVDGRSDIYALGVVLYEMVCGRVPFAADTEFTTALARLYNEPAAPRTLRPELSPDLDRVIMRMLARDPDQRWPDAASLARALTALSSGRALAPDQPPSAVTPPVSAAIPSTVGDAPPPAPWPPAVEQPLDLASAPAPPDPSRPQPLATAIEPDPWSEAEAARGARRRRRIVIGLAVLLPAVLLVAGGALAAWRLSHMTDTVGVTASAFDPFGGDGENDDQIRFVNDGDMNTTWSTERYRNRDVAAYKGGVGLVLDPRDADSFQRLTVVSPSDDWSAEVFVLEDPPGANTDDWGDPVTRADHISGQFDFDLDGADGRYLLLWITRTGTDHTVEIGGVALEAGS